MAERTPAKPRSRSDLDNDLHGRALFTAPTLSAQAPSIAVAGSSPPRSHLSATPPFFTRPEPGLFPSDPFQPLNATISTTSSSRPKAAASPLSRETAPHRYVPMFLIHLCCPYQPFCSLYRLFVSTLFSFLYVLVHLHSIGDH